MVMYETQEVKDLISESVRPVLWFMLQELDMPSPNHHFELSTLESEGKQMIVHTQRNTAYHREFSFKCQIPITTSVYVVGFDTDKWLMLLHP